MENNRILSMTNFSHSIKSRVRYRKIALRTRHGISRIMLVLLLSDQVYICK